MFELVRYLVLDTQNVFPREGGNPDVTSSSAQGDPGKPDYSCDLQPYLAMFTYNWGNFASVAAWKAWHGCDG